MHIKRKSNKPNINVTGVCFKCNTPYNIVVSWHNAIETGKTIVPENWKVVGDKILCPNCYSPK
jgi:hypothetical protein